MMSTKGQQPKIVQKQRKRERKTLFGYVELTIGKVITNVADRGDTTFHEAQEEYEKSYYEDGRQDFASQTGDYQDD